MHLIITVEEGHRGWGGGGGGTEGGGGGGAQMGGGGEPIHNNTYLDISPTYLDITGILCIHVECR